MPKITCFCEKEIDIDYNDSYDLDSDIRESILDGSFLTFTCPNCDAVLKPELPIHFISHRYHTDILLVPSVDRDRFLLGRTSYKATDTCAIGYEELVEKIMIIQAGLDDAIIEIIKFYMLEKINSMNEISIRLKSITEAALEFMINGLRDGETGISKINKSFYNEISEKYDSIKHEEPYSIIVEKPYISVTKIDLS